ncbi:MAG: hypothetical protein OEY67_11130 [Gammaproteobacteria bacterium]|nr:hypothetical protein [Gammaproteobacteria bacterium]
MRILFIITFIILLIVPPVAAKGLDAQANKTPASSVPDVLMTKEVEQTVKVEPEAENFGEMLYRNHCTSCHESNAHVRSGTKAKSVTDLKYWIERWSKAQNLPWGSMEKDAVLQYLRDTYYKF